MKKLELYIGTGEGGSHFFILQDGAQRNRLDFSQKNVDAMYAEAARLMEADTSIEPKLRIIDVTHTVVKSGDMFVSLETLKK